MGTPLAPQMVCGCLSNPSLSPTRPIHRPDLTCCELVCVPGRSMGAAAGASKGVAACTGAQTGRRALQVAAAARTWRAGLALPRIPDASCQRSQTSVGTRIRQA